MRCFVLLAVSCFVLCGRNKTKTIHFFQVWITQIRIRIYSVYCKQIMLARRMSALGTNFERFSFFKYKEEQTNTDRTRQSKTAKTSRHPDRKVSLGLDNYGLWISYAFITSFSFPIMSIQHRWSCWCGDFGSKRCFLSGIFYVRRQIPRI